MGTSETGEGREVSGCRDGRVLLLACGRIPAMRVGGWRRARRHQVEEGRVAMGSPGMPEHDGRRLDLRSLLAAVEVAPPVAAVDVFAAELGNRLGAEEVSFLISDFNGGASPTCSSGASAVNPSRWPARSNAACCPPR